MLDRRMFLKTFAVLLVSFSLAACGPAPKARGLTWSKAPGGGVVAFTEPTASSEFAVRCIPSDGGERCLLANELDATSMTFQVVDRKDLNEADLWTNKDGFKCTFLLGLASSQSVQKGGADLISASAPYIGNVKLPPRAETEQFMKLNVPDAKAVYFDCARVANVFSQGSLATAGTSAITAEMLK